MRMVEVGGRGWQLHPTDPTNRADQTRSTCSAATRPARPEGGGATLDVVDTEVVRLHTGARRLTDLTNQVAGFVRTRGDGIVHVFAPHATAGLAILELGAGSDDDLDELLDRVFPRDDRYRHRHGSPGHGADHLLPVFVAPSLSVPVVKGALALGTWQSIVLVDPNADNPDRQVRFSFLAG